MKYPKIQSPWKRDLKRPGHPFRPNEFSTPWLEFLADCPWEWTEKIDGMNIRVLYDPEGGDASLFPDYNPRVSFLGRTDKAVIPQELAEELQRVFVTDPIAPLSDTLTGPITLYGEGVGPKIQRGKHGFTAPRFILFDARVEDHWLPRDAVEGIAKGLGLRYAPVISTTPMTIWEAAEYVMDGFQSTFGPFAAEGLVGRPPIEFRAAGKRVITKLKTKDFAHGSRR